MSEYKVYTPWDSVIVEADSEKEARVAALRQLLSEIEFATPDMLDAERLDELG